MLRLALSLFLVLACLTVLCAGIQRSLTIEEENLEKGIAEIEKSYNWLKKNGKEMASLVADATGTIAQSVAAGFGVPLPGATISSILKLPLKLIPEADKMEMIQSEMAVLNTRLDIFYEELKWASNDFQKVINSIDHAWLKYQQMKKNENALKSTFCPFYNQYAGSVLVLHKLLTSKTETGEQSLVDVLAKKLRCHEKHLEETFLYLKQLVCRANEMDQKCYQLMGVEDKSLIPDPTKILEESNEALFKAQQRCVSNSELYIKRDILERITDEIHHEDLAENILSFLKEKYDRYDWLVVAFTTHFSKDRVRFMKRHIFSGFTGVERGSVTVAVAYQVKGNHEGEIKTEIENGFKDVRCSKVEEKLEKLKLKDAITAVHVYQRPHRDEAKEKQEKAQQGQEEEEEDNLPVSAVKGEDKSYTVSGECKTKKGLGIHTGHYTILIKSEEERANKEPCPKDFCKNQGKCEAAPRTRIPLCQCKEKYYGRQCEKLNICPITDSRARRQ